MWMLSTELIAISKTILVVIGPCHKHGSIIVLNFRPAVEALRFSRRQFTRAD